MNKVLLTEQILIDAISAFTDEEDYIGIFEGTITSFKKSRITSVGDYVFYNCTALTTVSLPEATSIGNYAFSKCTALTEIHFSAANQATIEALSSYSSKFGATNATIYFDL